MIEITVPRLGWSMEEGAFVAWLKKDGEMVRPGDPLFSIEGDKAVQEIESMDAGVLRIAASAPAPGSPIRVGDLLGHLLSREEIATGLEAAPSIPSPQSGPSAVPGAAPTPGRASPPARPGTTTGTTAGAGAPGGDGQPETTAEFGLPDGVQNPAISPRARRVARELGVDWSRLQGSGRTGRIREQDVRAAAQRGDLSGSRGPKGDSGQPAAVFFGELLLRLGTRHHERFTQAREFEARYTGAEANAAVSLASFGAAAHLVSAVPDHELGQACVNFIRQFGVNIDHVLRCGRRLGTFYLETGAPPRPSRVIYDRAGSAFAELRPGQINWEKALAGRQWFHWSGTAPALGPGLPAVVAEACATARRLGLTVSCDLNFRSLLWDAADARRTMVPLMQNVDVLIGNDEQVRIMLGVAGQGAAAVADNVRAQFNIRAVALTQRGGPAGAPWRASLGTERGVVSSRDYPLASVDRIGAGDAFSGALIYGLLQGWPDAEVIEFAAAAGALKHSVPGDFNLVTREEVLAVVAGDAGLRVRR